ncbi:MAG: hypothetical protein ACYTAN_13870, partial [Planctomycetota bacterium]
GLAVPMMVHFANNAFAVALAAKLFGEDLLQWEIKGPAAAALTACLVLAGLALLWSARRIARPESH